MTTSDAAARERDMPLAFLTEVFKRHASAEAVIWNEITVTYAGLLERTERWTEALPRWGIPPGAVVRLDGDFSPNAIAVLLALIDRSCIIMPQSRSHVRASFSDKIDAIAMPEWRVSLGADDAPRCEQTGRRALHPFYGTLRGCGRPGLVLFSSGTSGEPKAAVHDLSKLLCKFKTKRTAMRTLVFLLFDHWGGLNTMFHALSNGSTVISVEDRSPDNVCALLGKHAIELLPTSPTFLNLILLSEAYKRHDLSSLRVISYGTEPMPQVTLQRVKTLFPAVKLHQTYGLIEVGVLRTKGRGDDSLWVKVGGEGYQTRVVDGCLQIKADSAMLGYMNASSPFTEDGWFITGDAVLVDGEYMTILGRKSELINVGGEKVYPAEIEGVIQAMSNVAEVTVYGEKNPITGNIVCARVRLAHEEDPHQFTARLKAFCRDRLAPYKVPVKVNLSDSEQFNQRFKKTR